MINHFRFELSFKDINQLENKLNFCRKHGIKNINIPCKGSIKKELYISTIEHIMKKHEEFNVTFHYSLYHQYIKNKENSYDQFINFIRKYITKRKYNILLLSGSNKKKNFDVLNVLEKVKEEKNLKKNFGIAYNPYLSIFDNNNSERERYEQKVLSGLIKSVWLQYGTDIKVLKREIKFLKNHNVELFGSLLIPSKQFIARFNYRPWKEVYISEKYLCSLENFYSFTQDLVNFYIENKIIPLVETDFYSLEKLKLIQSFIHKKSKLNS